MIIQLFAITGEHFTHTENIGLKYAAIPFLLS